MQGKTQEFIIVGSKDPAHDLTIKSLSIQGTIKITANGELTAGGYCNTFSGPIDNPMFISNTEMASMTDGVPDLETYLGHVLHSTDYKWAKVDQSGKTFEVEGADGKGLTLRCVS